jgi:hypothetical protein
VVCTENWLEVWNSSSFNLCFCEFQLCTYVMRTLKNLALFLVMNLAHSPAKLAKVSRA